MVLKRNEMKKQVTKKEKEYRICPYLTSDEIYSPDFLVRDSIGSRLRRD